MLWRRLIMRSMITSPERKPPTETWAQEQSRRAASRALEAQRAAALPPTTLAAQMDAYAEHLASPGVNSNRLTPYSEHTVRAYLTALRSLCWFLTEVYEFPKEYGFHDMTTDNFVAWQTWYTDYPDPKGNPRTASGAATQYRNVQHFFRWLSQEHEVPNILKGLDDTAKMKLRAKPAKSAVIPDDMVASLLRIHSRKTDPLSVRNYAILRCLLTGMRAGQVAAMTVETTHLVPPDLDRQPWTKAYPKAVVTETTEWFKVYLPPLTVRAINLWLPVRHLDFRAPQGDSGPMWWGKNKGFGPLGTSGIRQMLDATAVKAGIDKRLIHAHLFRHKLVHFARVSGISDSMTRQQTTWGSDTKMFDVYADSEAPNDSLDTFAQRFTAKDPWEHTTIAHLDRRIR